MIYVKQQKTFQDSLKFTCYAALNATAALGLASIALSHYETQFCISSKDLSKSFSSERNLFCLPGAETIKVSKSTDTFLKTHLGTAIANPLLNFSSIVAGILSVYFAREAVRCAKAVF